MQEKLTAAQARLEGARSLAEGLPMPDGPVDKGGEPPFPLEQFPPEQLSAQLAAVEGELARARHELALATGELSTMGDGPALEARHETLEEELLRRRAEHEALTIALEALSAANTEMRARFSPALNAAAGDILAALTGGRYRRVGLDRQFEAQALAEASCVPLGAGLSSTLPRPALALSQGAAEQVYLATRLAVCQLALPADDPAPIVLDDALDAFDDERMALALDYLLGLGEERQILLFTCHSREERYLEGSKAARLSLT